MGKTVRGFVAAGVAVAAGLLASGTAHADGTICNPDTVTGSTAYACASGQYPTDSSGVPTGAPTEGDVTVSSSGAPLGGVIGISGTSDGATISVDGSDSNPGPTSGSQTITVPPS